MADKVINGSLDITGEISQNGHSIAPQISVTWAELKTLRDGGTLVPGQQYRITDYQCATSANKTLSAGHQFDIIVTADSANKLNEVARACLQSGDTYFASNKLEAWKLWYCIDNDTTRFGWADATNGKGVIYRMIDEFDNDVPYDFKNILFTTSGKYTNAYTFTYTESSTIKDASLLGVSKGCYNNVIKEYILSNKQALNFNVFYSTSTSFNCRSNTFSNSCSNNTFGNGCSYITFLNNCTYNTFGNYCSHNTFGNYCSHNTFGNYCTDSMFGNDCAYNTFGTSSSSINYCKNILLDNNCSYLYINSSDTSMSSSNYLQNVHVHLGVSGESFSNPKTLTVPDRNLAYETNFVADGTNNIIV